MTANVPVRRYSWHSARQMANATKHFVDATAYDAVAADNARLKADAERYRWLRAGGLGTGLYVADSGNSWRQVEGEQLDAAIDDATTPSLPDTKERG